MLQLKVRLAAAAFICIPLSGCLDSQDTLSPNDLAVSAVVAAPATPCVGNTALPRIAALSSSNESPALAAAMAIDGNPATRWSSAWSDPQWIRIDLGAPRFISAVTLKWEAASAQRYDIQISPDGNSWKSVQTVAWGQPGPATIPITGLNARGRYLRVYTHSRTTQYGVSLFEIEPRGDPNGSCTEVSVVRIDAVHSGKSLDVKDWSTQPGGNIQQWGYGGQDNQKWRLNPRPDGQYEIRNVFSQFCLDVQGNSMANGALIVQWNCHNGPNQSFLLESVGPGKFRIRAVSSGKCLDIKGVSTADGALLQQWDCNPAGQANQTFAIMEPGGFKDDPNNCGYAGHSCQGGLCSEGACQASIVANDFQCSSGMAADDQYIWIGDQAGLYRYDITGYNKTTVMSREPGSFMYDLQRNNGQFFWNDDRARRLNPGQTAPSAVTDFPMSQLAVNGSNLIGLDYPKNRFVSVDRNQTAPGAVTSIHTVPAGEYPMYSSVTSAYIYYVTGTSNGSIVYQVNRNTGVRKSLNGTGTGESVFGMTTFNESVYWSYRSASGISGIRRLSPLPGSTVQEAVPTGGSMQGVGNPMVDASGIYHSWYDGTTNGFYRTPHNNAGTRTLVTTYVYPYDARYVTFTSTSMIWLNACNRGGGGQVWKLAKP